MQWTLDAAAAKAEELGAELIYSTWGEQLIVDNGKVTGAYVHDKDGNYTQINAVVVLATGDWGNNQDICAIISFPGQRVREASTPQWTPRAPSATPRRSPDGPVGRSHMELGPHAPMTHHGRSLGVDGYLQPTSTATAS